MRVAQWHYAAGAALPQITSTNQQAPVTGGEERGHPMKAKSCHTTTMQVLRPRRRPGQATAVAAAALAAMAGIAVSQVQPGHPLNPQQRLSLESVQSVQSDQPAE